MLQYVNAREAARLVDVNERNIRQAIKEGRLGADRAEDGHTYRIAISELEKVWPVDKKRLHELLRSQRARANSGKATANQLADIEEEVSGLSEYLDGQADNVGMLARGQIKIRDQLGALTADIDKISLGHTRLARKFMRLWRRVERFMQRCNWFYEQFLGLETAFDNHVDLYNNNLVPAVNGLIDNHNGLVDDVYELEELVLRMRQEIYELRAQLGRTAVEDEGATAPILTAEIHRAPVISMGGFRRRRSG